MKFRPRQIIVAAVVLLVVIEILFLRPATLDTNEAKTKKGLFKDISTMVKSQVKDDEVRYTIQGFHYTAVDGEVKQWEMNSDTAILYNNSKKVVAANAKIKMFDAMGKITLIEGLEATYFMGNKDFELIKDVKVTFPDGFWLKTDKANYAGSTQWISTQSDFYGESQKTKTDFLQIWGKGFTASKREPLINILSESRVKIHRLQTNEVDDVKSDKSKIDRFTKVANFFMDQQTSFVESYIGTIQVKSRRQEANYDGAAHTLSYMIAYDDVYIKETDPVKEKEGLKYATCQRADFISKDDKIIMTGFPSVYQENDTVTGELITYYRTKSLVTVNQANGYHVPKNRPTPKSK